MTNIQFITDALRELGVIDAIQDPTPEDANLCLRVLNVLMMTLRRADNIDLGYFPQTDVNVDLPISDEDASLVLPIFAMALSINFPSSQVPPGLPGWAQTSQSALILESVLLNMQEAKMTNLPMGLRRR